MEPKRKQVRQARSGILAAGLLLAGVSLAAMGANAAPQVGVNAAVRGEVFVTGARDENKRRAQVSEEVYSGDVVETLRQSALQILLLDETVFTVGQNCRMTIDEFVYDPSTSLGEVAATITKGAFRFITGRIGTANPSNVSLKTPASTIGIRGTIGEGAVGEDAVRLCRTAGVQGPFDPNGASLVVSRGPGPRRNSFDKRARIVLSSANGAVELAEPGFAACVPAPGRAPVGPFKLTPDMAAYFDRWLRSTPAGPGVNPYGGDEPGSKLSGQDKFNTPAPDTDVFPDPRHEEIFDSNIPDFFGGKCDDYYEC